LNKASTHKSPDIFHCRDDIFLHVMITSYLVYRSAESDTPTAALLTAPSQHLLMGSALRHGMFITQLKS